MTSLTDTLVIEPMNPPLERSKICGNCPSGAVINAV